MLLEVYQNAFRSVSKKFQNCIKKSKNCIKSKNLPNPSLVGGAPEADEIESSVEVETSASESGVSVISSVKLVEVTSDGPDVDDGWGRMQT